jgi:hypothetical protein
MAITKTAQTEVKTGSEQSVNTQQKIQEMRALFADAPELGRRAPLYRGPWG